MALRIYNAVVDAGCDAMVDTLEDGAGAGKVQIYTGSQPALNGALSGTLLAEFTMSNPAFGDGTAAGSGSVATAASMPKTDAAAAATGTAGYGAAVDSDDVVKWTGTVTITGGGGDFTIDNLSITSGQEVQLTSWTFTLPQGS